MKDRCAHIWPGPRLALRLTRDVELPVRAARLTVEVRRAALLTRGISTPSSKRQSPGFLPRAHGSRRASPAHRPGARPGVLPPAARHRERMVAAEMAARPVSVAASALERRIERTPDLACRTGACPAAVACGLVVGRFRVTLPGPVADLESATYRAAGSSTGSPAIPTC